VVYQQTEAAKILQYLVGRSGYPRASGSYFDYILCLEFSLKQKHRMIIWYSSANQVRYFKRIRVLNFHLYGNKYLYTI
jgi:hypothetical protein